MIRLAALVSSYATPIVAFAPTKRLVEELAQLPGWMGIAGSFGDLDLAVEAFNDGALGGLALTYGAGSMGFRLPAAKTLVLIGTAPADVMAQACARAPQAKTVFL